MGRRAGAGRPTESHSQAIRCMHMVELLRGPAFWSTDELGRRFGVTERTARRDLEAIQSAGFRFLYDGFRYRLKPGALKETK